MPPESQEVRRWVEKADHDLAGAEAAMDWRPPITDVAAFHCQQAVEKLLKAYLVSRGSAFEKTHDLVELLARCALHDPDFYTLSGDITPLTPYAVRYRYPGPADPSENDVKSAMIAVRAVRQFVTDRL